MDSLVRFGLGSIESYTFDQANQTSLSSNFANILQRSVRLPGKDGGVSIYGKGRGPAEIGNVRVGFWVHGSSMADVGDKVASVREMSYWGLRRLFMKHRNGKTMWTWASVSDVQDAQAVERLPHLRQQVQMTFQCPETRWYSRDGMYFMDDDHDMNDGLTLPSLKLDQEAVQDGSTVSVTNNGNAPVSAYVRWDGNGSNSFTNPVITRKNWAGEVVDQLTYTDTIGANEVVEIDARKLTCTDVSKLTVLGLNWLTIPAGTWTLEISGTFTTTGLLTIDFWDGWI
jgi:hypothetical protein